MKINYVIKVSDVGGWYLSDCGDFEVDKFDGFKMFNKLYEMMEGVGVSDLSEEEFEDKYEISVMKDWMVVVDEDGFEEIIFMKVWFFDWFL